MPEPGAAPAALADLADEPQGSEAWDTFATAAPTVPTLPAVELPPRATLEQIVRDGGARGEDAHPAIAAVGLAGDGLWKVLTGTQPDGD
jgi:hypothetical protein